MFLPLSAVTTQPECVHEIIFITCCCCGAQVIVNELRMLVQQLKPLTLMVMMPRLSKIK